MRIRVTGKSRFAFETDFRNSKLEALKRFSQTYATTQSSFLKQKLGECVHIITKFDLTRMDASVLEKFNKNAGNWLTKIHLLGEKTGDKVSQDIKRKVNATIQKAKKDLQALVNPIELLKTSKKSEMKSANVTWIKTVQQARMGHKVSRNILKNLPEMCQNNFLEKVETLEQHIPLEQLGNLQREICSFSHHLLEAAKTIQNDKNYDARMQIICLDVLVDDLMVAFENKFASKPPRQKLPPMIARMGDKFILRKETAIENLCLRGGGGKGFGYAGALEVLQKTGKLDQLKTVSGSSAGAIAAVAIAFGIPPQSLGNFCDEVQVGVGKAKSREAVGNYSALKGMFSGIGLMGNAAGVIQAIDTVTTKNVRKFLQNPSVQYFLANQTDVFAPCEVDRLRSLMQEITFPREENAMLTFKDLELLVKIQGEGIENNFKSIVLTGWDATDGKEIYFDAQNTSDLPIAYAVRMSMALPIAFNAVEIDLTKYQQNGGQAHGFHKIMDGGLGSNSPNEMFIKPLTELSTEEERVQHQEAQACTLSCIFDDGGQAFAMDSSNFSYGVSLIKGVFLWLLGAIKSMFHMNTLRNDENKKLNDTGNIMVIGHGQLGTLNMSPTNEERNAVDLMSNLMAIDWVRQQGDGGAQIESSSLGALLKQLSIGDLRRIEIEDNEIQSGIRDEIQRRAAISLDG
ncbi:MAG: patatin-like phospholipase family protein [Puniceicoccales bacterium]|jgi:predicted acylesterase/phospholipase RssA|nr:patatin-like phospholipase family protein [Puniceicoccales bacterium]